MMLPPPGELLRDSLIPQKLIVAEARRRLSPDLFVSVQSREIPGRESEGWVVDERNKKSVRLRKPKPHDVAFEDRVWAAFAKLDFVALNKDRRLTIRYGQSVGETQQVDVFAADDEVVLVIDYYLELADHLGPAARFQLLGNLFAGSKSRTWILRLLQSKLVWVATVTTRFPSNPTVYLSSHTFSTETRRTQA